MYTIMAEEMNKYVRQKDTKRLVFLYFFIEIILLSLYLQPEIVYHD